MNESRDFRGPTQPMGKIHENFFPTREVAGIPPLSRDADRKPRNGGNRPTGNFKRQKTILLGKVEKEPAQQKRTLKKTKVKTSSLKKCFNSSLADFCSYVFYSPQVLPGVFHRVPLCSIYFYLLLVTFLCLVVEPPIWKISIKLDHFSK